MLKRMETTFLYYVLLYQRETLDPWEYDAHFLFKVSPRLQTSQEGRQATLPTAATEAVCRAQLEEEELLHVYVVLPKAGTHNHTGAWESSWYAPPNEWDTVLACRNYAQRPPVTMRVLGETGPSSPKIACEHGT